MAPPATPGRSAAGRNQGPSCSPPATCHRLTSRLISSRSRSVTWAASSAAQHDHAVAEPDGLADVMGHEQHGELAFRADPVQLVVKHVPGHRVERAERLVHQQHVRVLGQRPGQRDPLPHAAGQLVRSLGAGSWNMNATRAPPVETSPDVGCSSPATRESSVDLPQPEAPIRQVNSPGGTSSETWSSARTAAPPRPNTLDTDVSLTGSPTWGAARRSVTVTEFTCLTIGYELTWDSPAAASTLLSGSRLKIPSRLSTGLSKPSSTAWEASVFSEAAFGS